MKPRTATLACVLLTLSFASGCGGAEGGTRGVNAPALRAPTPSGYPTSEAAWERLPVVRFRMEIPLFDRPHWQLEERESGPFVATHRRTESRVTALIEPAPALMNHQRCEARARERGLLPQADLHTVDEAVTVGPGLYDTRIWVAIREPSAPGGPLTGHVFAFGAYVRKCLFVDIETTVPRAEDEPVLAQRLATARVRLVGGLAVPDLEFVPRATEGR